MATPPTPPTPPNSDPSAKFQSTPVFMAVINELNVNVDQLNKRQALIKEIENALTARYGCANRLITYFMRFGHARTLMHTSDIPHIETQIRRASCRERV